MNLLYRLQLRLRGWLVNRLLASAPKVGGALSRMKARRLSLRFAIIVGRTVLILAPKWHPERPVVVAEMQSLRSALTASPRFDGSRWKATKGLLHLSAWVQRVSRRIVEALHLPQPLAGVVAAFGGGVSVSLRQLAARTAPTPTLRREIEQMFHPHNTSTGGRGL